MWKLSDRDFLRGGLLPSLRASHARRPGNRPRHILRLAHSLHRPVENIVGLVPLAQEEVPEEFAQVGVVRARVEPKLPDVLEVCDELVGVAAAQQLDGGGHLLLRDPVVLLLLRLPLEALPWQGAPEEVDENVADRLQVVPAALLEAEVCVRAAVASRAGEVLALFVGDVLVRLRVAVLLCEAEVDDVDVVALLARAHEEVVRLDVAVQEAFRVDELHAADHLVGQHERRLQREFSPAEAEQVFERGPEEVDDHDVVVALHAVPADRRKPDSGAVVVEDLIQAGLVDELRMARLQRL